MRLKKIYVIHAAWFVNQAFAIARPFIKTELMSLLHFTTGGADEIFEPELLPLVSLFLSFCIDGKAVKLREVVR